LFSGSISSSAPNPATLRREVVLLDYITYAIIMPVVLAMLAVLIREIKR